MTADTDVASLIDIARNHATADLYRMHWGTCSDFGTLPFMTREILAATSLPRRKYKDAVSMLKIVDYHDDSFVSAWGYHDIGRQVYGAASQRPMVCFSDPYETVEKGIWCHMNGMTHLGGERNLEIAIATGLKFQIDSLITDTATVAGLLPLLKGRTKISCISIVDSSFDTETIAPCAEFADRVRLVFALPETGTIAEADFTMDPVFTPQPGCVLEFDDTLVVTKLQKLVTPIIRYASGVSTRPRRENDVQFVIVR